MRTPAVAGVVVMVVVFVIVLVVLALALSGGAPLKAAQGGGESTGKAAARRQRPKKKKEEEEAAGEVTTYRQLLEEAADDSPYEYATLTEGELDREFAQRHGADSSVPFTAWSCRRVYFPTTYDGLARVAWVPRNPPPAGTADVAGWKTEPVGG